MAGTSVLIAMECHSEIFYSEFSEEHRPEPLVIDALEALIQNLRDGVRLSELHMKEIKTPNGQRFGRVLIR